MNFRENHTTKPPQKMGGAPGNNDVLFNLLHYGHQSIKIYLCSTFTTKVVSKQLHRKSVCKNVKQKHRLQGPTCTGGWPGGGKSNGVKEKLA